MQPYQELHLKLEYGDIAKVLKCLSKNKIPFVVDHMDTINNGEHFEDRLAKIEKWIQQHKDTPHYDPPVVCG